MILDDAPVTPETPASTPAQEGQPQQQEQVQQTPEKQSLGWRAQFPAEAHEILKSFEKPGDFYKAASEWKGKADGAFTIPKADDKDGWTKLFNTLGRPENPDAYQFTKDEKLRYDEAQEKEFRKWAYEQGMTQAQASALFQREVESALKSREAKRAADAKAMEEVKTSWGQKFEENMEKAKRAAVKIGDPQILEGATPKILKLLAAVHDLTSATDNYIPGAPAPQKPVDDRYPNTKFK
jgi:hypothetical protein